jgi:hypothetical protein
MTFLFGTICAFILTKFVNRKLIIFYALLFTGVFLFLTGPSYVFALVK